MTLVIGRAGRLAEAKTHDERHLEQQREPADQDVGADALLEPVEDRPQVQLGLQVAEGVLGFEQVVVAQRHVGGGQVRVGGGQQELAVEALFVADAGPVDTQPAGGQLADVAAVRAVVAQRAFGFGVRRLLGLAALNRRCRYRGVKRNQLGFSLRVAAVNLTRQPRAAL